LNTLIERYLEPLKTETFLSSEDIEQLFGNIREIVQFQRLFLRSLEEAIEIEPDFLQLVDTKQFRVCRNENELDTGMFSVEFVLFEIYM
jgi:hypothetical protein